MASDQIPENLSAQVQGWFCNSRALIPGFKSDRVMPWTLDEWDHVGPVLPASVWTKLQCVEWVWGVDARSFTSQLLNLPGNILRHRKSLFAFCRQRNIVCE